MPLPESLRFPYRLLLIVAAGLLPAGVVAWQLIAVLGRDADVARRASGRVDDLMAVKAFARAALEQRREAGDWIAGRGAAAAAESQAAAVDAALKELEARAGLRSEDEPRRLVAAVRAEWGAVREHLAAWARSGDFESFWQRSVELLRRVRELAAAAEAGAGARALVLLIDAADDLSQAALLARRAARQRWLDPAAEARLRRLLGRLDQTGSALRAEPHGPDARRSGIRAALGEYDDLRAEAARRVEADVLGGPGTLSEQTGAAAVRLSQRGADQALELFDPLARALDDELRRRVAARDHTTTWAVVWLIVSLMLALQAAYLIGRSLVRPPVAARPGGDVLRALAERARATAEGLRAAPAPANVLPRVAEHAARLNEAAREIADAARQLDETTDETSVAALNVAIEAVSGGTATATDLEPLAERAAAAAQRVAALAQTIEAEVSGMAEALGEPAANGPPPAAAQAEHLAALADQLQAAAAAPPPQA